MQGKISTGESKFGETWRVIKVGENAYNTKLPSMILSLVWLTEVPDDCLTGTQGSKTG